MLRRRMMMAQGGVSLPAGYTKIEYLESDGNHYIDTGFKPNQDTRVVMDVHLLSTTTGDGYPMAFGVYTNNTNRFASFWNNSKWQVWLGDSSSSISSSNIERCVIDLQNGQYTVGSQSTSVSSSSFSSNLTLYLLAMNQGDVYYVSAARIYSCRIYDNGTLVRDFIPAMNASGEAGLYDLKNGVWYALKPVVTKKENKITLSFLKTYLPPPTGSDITDPLPAYKMSANAAYPVASTIDIITKSDSVIYDVNLSISSGSYYSSNTLVGYKNYYIVSISPTEDDTYIYTF